MLDDYAIARFGARCLHLCDRSSLHTETLSRTGALRPCMYCLRPRPGRHEPQTVAVLLPRTRAWQVEPSVAKTQPPPYAVRNARLKDTRSETHTWSRHRDTPSSCYQTSSRSAFSEWLREERPCMRGVFARDPFYAGRTEHASTPSASHGRAPNAQDRRSRILQQTFRFFAKVCARGDRLSSEAAHKAAG